MLPNLRVALFFVCSFVESFKKIFMHRLAIDSIIVYNIIIMPNILDKVVNSMKLRIVKVWSNSLESISW